MLKRLASLAFSVLLACGLVPAAAFAQPDAAAMHAEESMGLVEGSYAEHEALAYVVDDARGGFMPFSLGDDLLANAQNLMEISPEAAAQAFDAAANVDDSFAPSAVRTRSLAADDDAGEGRIVLVRDESKTTEELIAELSADPRVIVAEPNYATVIDDGVDLDAEGADSGDQPDSSASQDGSSVDGASDSDASAAGEIPDMTEFQWAYNNLGTFGGEGSAGFDMGYDGWNDAQGSDDDVVVAVVDTGVDASNPDLADKMFNASEYPEFQAAAERFASSSGGMLGVDEHGCYATPYSSSCSGFADTSEGHGTHCAGIIAAAWNGAGVSGMAQNAQIMSVRVTSFLGGIIQGFNYIQLAAAYGVPVKVANNSWTLGVDQSQIINLAVMELGQQAGVVCVFGSANSATDMDAQSMTAGVLSENPYAVVVNSIDPSGDVSVFSNYGKQSTHTMAPGTSILSTIPVQLSQYLGEVDDGAVLYESFDGKSRTKVDGARLVFSDESAAQETDVKRFDGEKSMALPYDPVQSDYGSQQAETQEIDLSSIPEDERPRYVSVRFATPESEWGTEQRVSDVTLGVRTTDGTFVDVDFGDNAFSAYGDSWGGGFGVLPDNTDWEHFQIALLYQLFDIQMEGGERVIAPVEGSVLIDSIGLGSDLTPYRYLQGTSMAGPAVSGAVAVLAERFPDDAADERAARVKGSARAIDGVDWSEFCQTGGIVDVDVAEDPSPVISSVEDLSSEVRVEGWFFGDGATVSLGDAAVEVAESVQDASNPQKWYITAEKPEGFEGGRTEVKVTAADGQQGRFFAAFTLASSSALYDQANLEVPAEVQTWGAWQLVGFAGKAYCLPRYSCTSLIYPMFIYCYDPEAGEWLQVDLPADIVQSEGFVEILDISGATVNGSLVLRLTGASANGYAVITFMSLNAEGEWSVLTTRAPEVPLTALFGTLASDGETLYSFGGLDNVTGLETAEVFSVDPESGTHVKAGELGRGRVSPNVTYRDGEFLVAGGIAASLQYAGVQNVERISIASDGSLEATEVDMSGVVDGTGQLIYGVGSAADGFVLVGPQSRDGQADTYTLSDEEGATPAPYEKRASQHLLQMSSALAYDGRLYVLSSMMEEPYRLLSVTAMETAAQPGDSVAPDPGPDPDPDPDPDPAPDPTPDPAPDPNPDPDPAPDQDVDSDGGSDQGGNAGTPGDSHANDNSGTLAATSDAASAAWVAAAAVAVLASLAVCLAAFKKRARANRFRD